MSSPAYLAPDWRYAKDDWAGSNALVYPVWATPPVYAADGVTIVTPGVAKDLTGYSAAGVITEQATGRVLSAPVGAIVAGVGMSLSIAQTLTNLCPQPLSDWGTAGNAKLLVRPRVIDPSGNEVTIGIQPLFVF